MDSTKEKLIECAYQEIYKHGYQGASISAILKCADAPKGSLYHHFKSKKELALAVINTKITPGLNELFDTLNSSQLVTANYQEQIFALIDKISDKEHLVTYGCPLNKLIQEMVVLDKEFASLLTGSYQQLLDKLTLFTQSAIEQNQIKGEAKSIALFIFQTLWGYLSITPQLSTKEQFLETKRHISIYLNAIKPN